jgi:hypothetical protein
MVVVCLNSKHLMNTPGPGDARAVPGGGAGRDGHDPRYRTGAAREGLPRSHRGPEQLLSEPLSRKDAKAVADLLAPVRDHMRSTPPRSAVVRRRRA